MNTINQYIRADLQDVVPYSSARDEFKGEATIWLDANENPLITQWNRYPDPKQKALKAMLAKEKGISVEQLFLGNGSDEVLDLLCRLIARPFTDRVAYFDPSYGMYEVLAKLNGLESVRIPLQKDFTPDWELTRSLLEGTNLFVVCRPNNPTGNLFDRKRLLDLLSTYKGVMIIDEAYMDFSEEASLSALVEDYPNLIVVQTLSKAYGMAGLRIGMAIANEQWIKALNSIKPPYNISSIVQETAIACLQNENYAGNRQVLLSERKRLEMVLRDCSIVLEVIPSEANFLLFRVKDADGLYNYLSNQGIVVRNRSKQLHCEGMLRVTVGTPLENEQFIQALKTFQS